MLLRAVRGAVILLAAVAVLVMSAHLTAAHAEGIPTVPCAKGGVSHADQQLARRLNTTLTQGMQGGVTGYQASCASTADQVV